jgi:hypothetical protein
MSTNRIRVLLASLLAVLAVSAVASASASATCYRVAVAHTGHWENNTCTTVGTTKEYVEVEKLETHLLNPGEWCAKVKAGEPSTFSDNKCTVAHVGTGEFTKVLVPEFSACGFKKGAGSKYASKAACEAGTVSSGEWERIHFTDKEGVSHLNSLGVVITCQKDTSSGEITGPNTVANVKVTFEECKAKKGTEECAVNGGTINTETLSGELGNVAVAEAASTVGEDLKPPAGKPFVKLTGTCIVNTSVEGSVIGEVIPVGGPPKLTGELNFKCEPAGSTKQKIQKFVGGVKDTLSAFSNPACFESFPDVITFEEAIEVT